MSAAAPEPEPVTGPTIKIEAYLLADPVGDRERRCDICGRIPLARKGCYAAIRLGFLYLEGCRRCVALAQRAFARLP
jgi:hypothetical protein